MSAARARGGQLVVENVALLAGGANAFESRYKVCVCDDSFRKPGNNKVALPLLHFLLCSISPDEAPNAFKPCFPVLDRDQERDFRKLVDARLAALERAKLLPPGVARKSTVAAAGGDKFEQLVWTLSTLALKQAALRHPAHGGAAHNPDPKPPTASDTASNRRYAALLRSRIASERAAFARTTQMGRDSTAKWTSEIAALKDRIAQIASRTAEVKQELKQLGFDETVLPAKTEMLSTPSVTSQSGKHHLGVKTSPIESDDSGSVDGGEADLNRMLAFTGESTGLAKDAGNIVRVFEKSEQTSLGTDLVMNFPPHEDDEPRACANVADLVQAAVQELEKATSRMNNIAAASKQPATAPSEAPTPSEKQTPPDAVTEEEVVFLQPSKLTEEAKNCLSLHEAILQSTRSLAKSAAVAARESTARSQALQASMPAPQQSSFLGAKDSQELATSLLVLSHASVENKKSSAPMPPPWAAQLKKEPTIIDDEGENDSKVAPHAVFNDEMEPMSFEPMDVDAVGSSSNTPHSAIDSKLDFLTTVNDLQKAHAVVLTSRNGPPRNSGKAKKNTILSGGRVRSKDGELPFHQVPLDKMPKRKKGAKLVRFAELPPSYSETKSSKSSTSPVMESHPKKASDDKKGNVGLGSVKALPMRDILVGKKCDNDCDDQASSSSSSSCGSPTKLSQDDDGKVEGDVILRREDEYFTPTGSVVSSAVVTGVDAKVAGETKAVTGRLKPVTRKPTPRHLATRRATVIRNVISERTDSNVGQAAKQKLKKVVGKKTDKPSTATASGNTENQPKPKIEQRKPKIEQTKTPETPASPKTPVPVTSPPPAEDEKPQKQTDSPETPTPLIDEPESAPSLMIKMDRSEVTPLAEIAYEDRKEANDKTPRSQIVKVFSNEFTPKREKHRRHSVQGLKSDGKKNKSKKKASKYSKSAADSASPKEGAEAGDDPESEPRRSVSTPEYVPRRTSLTYRQTSNSGGGTSRLISFQALYGKRRNKAERAAAAAAAALQEEQSEQTAEKTPETPRRRASIAGEDSPMFSWLTGVDRRSNVGRGETYQTPPADSGGGVFRQTSTTFSGGRRSSVFSRKGSGAGRPRNEDGTPKSRVKALRDRIAALGRRGDFS